MRRLWVFLLLVGLFLVAVADDAVAQGPHVDVLKVDGAITPVLASYIERGIAHAEGHGAIACVIELDTPGGLDTAMRDIVQAILEADVPVVVYVPPGGRAASAGAFITLAAHVAAMAPATEIGAAHPVAIGEDGMDETMEAKVVNDAVAYIRSIADTRGRDADIAEAMVRESASLSAQDALDEGVIDVIASGVEDLLQQIDGWQVALLDGEVVTLETAGVPTSDVGMGAMERFLSIISDPNIAYILLSVGMLGIMVELFNPGLIFPGVVGAISLLLSFYALGMLPVNYAGIILIVVAFALFIAEVFVTSHGLLAVGGIASLTIGSVILMSSPLFRISPAVIAVVVIAVTAFFTIVVAAIVRTHRRPQQTGREGMVGKVAVARTPLDPTGTVFIHGERWEATVDEGRVEPGEEVVVTQIEGLALRVARKQSEGGEGT